MTLAMEPHKALSAALLSHGTAQEIRTQFLRSMMAAFNAPLGSCYDAAFDAEIGLVHCNMICLGTPAFEAFGQMLDGVTTEEIGAAPENLVSFHDPTIYVSADLPEELLAMVWRPHGIGSAISFNAQDDGRFCGNINAFRLERDGDPFDAHAPPAHAGEWGRVARRLLTLTRAMSLAEGGLDREIYLFGMDGTLFAENEVAQTELKMAAADRSRLADTVRAFAASGDAMGDELMNEEKVTMTRVSDTKSAAIVVSVSRLLPVLLTSFIELSPTQRRVAAYAAHGATVPEIASAMCRSAATIQTHIKAVYERLEIESRAELATIYQRAKSGQ